MKRALIVLIAAMAVSTPARADMREQIAERECEARTPDEGDRERLPDRQIVLIEAAATFWLAFGYGGAGNTDPDPESTFGYGPGAHLRVDVPLLTPLWISAQADLSFSPFIGMFDATVGYSFHSYGFEYTSAGEINAARAAMTGSGGTYLATTQGVCTVERDDWVLFAGGKLATFSEDPDPGFFAAQLGIAHHAAHSNGRMHWDLALLYSPNSEDLQFGIQGQMASSIFAEWLHMYISAGWIGGGVWSHMGVGGQFQL